MLWYWCLDYALDGDLSRKEPKMIEQSCDIPLKLLVKAGFVDSRPYRRIHDWWQNQGNYLKVRFKNQPENWQRIESLYKRRQEPSMHRSVDRSKDGSNSMDVSHGRTDVTDVRTDVDFKASAGFAAAPPPAANGGKLPEVKSYEEAGENDLCGPPKGMAEQFRKGLK